MTRKEVWSNLGWLAAFAAVLVLGQGGYLQRAYLMTGLGNASAKTDVANAPMLSGDVWLVGLDGSRLQLSELKGKTVFVNLWATWCGPCRAEMPSIASLYGKVDKDKVAFVMISRDDPNHPSQVQAYLDANAFDFPVYWSASALPTELKSNSIPATFIISPEGSLIYRHTGIANYDTDKFREMLERGS